MFLVTSTVFFVFAAGRVIGQVYADLFPREGKHNHGSTIAVRKGRRLEDGSYAVTQVVWMDNLSPARDNGKPALLPINDVIYALHEFGHALHEILTTVPYAAMSGTSVGNDFVEVPSQMLENWVTTPETLQLFSGHYKDGSQIPLELAQKVVANRQSNVASDHMRQIVYGLTDMVMHRAQGDVDVTTIYEGLYKELMTFAAATKFMGTFAQSGYGCYRYLWSEVYSDDLFSRFASEGTLNPRLGMHYRRSILERGGTREPQQMLRDFLGRDSNSEAWAKKLGI